MTRFIPYTVPTVGYYSLKNIIYFKECYYRHTTIFFIIIITFFIYEVHEQTKFQKYDRKSMSSQLIKASSTILAKKNLTLNVWLCVYAYVSTSVVLLRRDEVLAYSLALKAHQTPSAGTLLIEHKQLWVVDGSGYASRDLCAQLSPPLKCQLSSPDPFLTEYKSQHSAILLLAFFWGLLCV